MCGKWGTSSILRPRFKPITFIAPMALLSAPSPALRTPIALPRAYTTCQKKQSVVFVGANDGMLHAFQTGVISTAGLNPSKFQVAELTGIPTSSMGQELWGFIPTNSLPYLRCLASPSGCHLYYNDLSPYITTMNLNQQYCSNAPSQSCTQNSDCGSGSCMTKARTVLIGGMRLGGAAISSANYCLNSSGQAASPDDVLTELGLHQLGPV